MIRRIVFLGITSVLLLVATDVRAESSLICSEAALNGSTINSDSSFTPIKTMARLASATKSGRRLSMQKKNPLAGHWSLFLTKRSDSCSMGSPASLNIKINISNKLVGTDEIDGSPFFQGTTRGSNLYFARGRMLNANCKFSQSVALLGVRGKSAGGQLNSRISCSDGSNCLVVHAGRASKF